MAYETAEGIRWTAPKQWGPLNKTGRLIHAPAPRTLEQARKEREHDRH